jgi:hypothetical protein
MRRRINNVEKGRKSLGTRGLKGDEGEREGDNKKRNKMCLLRRRGYKVNRVLF